MASRHSPPEAVPALTPGHKQPATGVAGDEAARSGYGLTGLRTIEGWARRHQTAPLDARRRSDRSNIPVGDSVKVKVPARLDHPTTTGNIPSRRARKRRVLRYRISEDDDRPAPHPDEARAERQIGGAPRLTRDGP